MQVRENESNEAVTLSFFSQGLERIASSTYLSSMSLKKWRRTGVWRDEEAEQDACVVEEKRQLQWGLTDLVLVVT
jgi:uncharacterized protein YjcR